MKKKLIKLLFSSLLALSICSALYLQYEKHSFKGISFDAVFESSLEGEHEDTNDVLHISKIVLDFFSFIREF